MTEKTKPQYAVGEAYLIIKGIKGNWGWQAKITEIRKNKPAVGSDEIAMLVHVKLPAALFEKPLLSAKVTVDADVPAIEFSEQTVSELRNVIRSATGLDVQLTVIPPAERE